jgi:hypothetical protein
VVLWEVTGVSEERVASIFRVAALQSACDVVNEAGRRRSSGSSERETLYGCRSFRLLNATRTSLLQSVSVRCRPRWPGGSAHFLRRGSKAVGTMS